jgi:hypothetical protein
LEAAPIRHVHGELFAAGLADDAELERTWPPSTPANST